MFSNIRLPEFSGDSRNSLDQIILPLADSIAVNFANDCLRLDPSKRASAF